MNIQNYTTRSQEAIQKAHSFAQDRNNPRFEVEHLLSDHRAHGARGAVDAELNMSPELAKAFSSAEKIAKKFHGISNQLFFEPKTKMLFGDAKASLTTLLKEAEEL